MRLHAAPLHSAPLFPPQLGAERLLLREGEMSKVPLLGRGETARGTARANPSKGAVARHRCLTTEAEGSERTRGSVGGDVQCQTAWIFSGHLNSALFRTLTFRTSWSMLLSKKSTAEQQLQENKRHQATLLSLRRCHRCPSSTFRWALRSFCCTASSARMAWDVTGGPAQRYFF